ncbi:hypothetical protein [Allocoleopsis franciscana]|uniref:Uncharacterized protein n=1 Tax=Allocoleopsis franciscana PCC 7113 TaxID=1173027 RepID=K9WE00_9CYAN|nr:hypothetical protein [Allocoleopsis franciscana]AFZ18463.1 hypothetical protein Mic7113_2676 [Allocoleopsis franciscana PCC 7113]
MKKSDTFLNLVFWVIAGATFATGAVVFSPRADREPERAAVVQPVAPIALDGSSSSMGTSN